MEDPINNLRPGTVLTDKQKEELGKANAASSADAHRMAADRRAQDERDTPLVQTLADSVRQKLEALPPEKPE